MHGVVELGEVVGGLVPGEGAVARPGEEQLPGPHVGQKVDQIAPQHAWKGQQALTPAVVDLDEVEALEGPVDQQQAIDGEQGLQQPATEDRLEVPGLWRQHGVQPKPCQDQHQQGGDQRQGVGHQATTVAPQKVVETPVGAAPAQMLITLEDDTGDPAGLLPDHRAQRRGEVLAHTDHLAVTNRQAVGLFAPRRQLVALDAVAHEDTGQSAFVQAKADIVVFGQTPDVEGDAVIELSQVGQRTTTEAGADPGAGHLAAHGLANQHVLAVVLGELVDVVAAGELIPAWTEGVDRDLDQVLVRQQIVVKPKLHRRNDVFGVMQDAAGKLDPGGLLEARDGLDDVVQTVGLAGGAGAYRDHLVHVAEALADRIYLGLGLGVVRVGADEDLIVLVVHGAGHQLGHLADHADFLPGRHHDRQRFLPGLIQALLVGPGVIAIDRPVAPATPGPVDQIEKQIIDAHGQHQQAQRYGDVLQGVQHMDGGVDQPQ